MNSISRHAVAAQIAVTCFIAGAFDRARTDDRGQGSVEYVGVVVVAAVIVAALILAVQSGIAEALVAKIMEAIDKISAG